MSAFQTLAVEILGDRSEGFESRAATTHGDCTSASWSNTITPGPRPPYATGDAARIRLVPLPPPGRPQDETKAMSAGFDHRRTRRLAERGEEPARANTDVLQGVDRRIQVRRTQRGHRTKSYNVAIAVGFHLVPPARSSHQLGVPRHVLTQTEEGRGEGECIEAVKDIAVWCGGPDRRRR